jgi:hypothetical protein
MDEGNQMVERVRDAIMQNLKAQATARESIYVSDASDDGRVQVDGYIDVDAVAGAALEAMAGHIALLEFMNHKKGFVEGVHAAATALTPPPSGEM